MSTPEFRYKSEHARAWVASSGAMVWEVWGEHRFTGEMGWHALPQDAVRLQNIMAVAPDHPCAWEPTDAPVGACEIWIVPTWTGKEGQQLVVSRTAERTWGQVFWRWRTYVRHPLVMPGAAFAYERVADPGHMEGGHALLRVLTAPPDMVIPGEAGSAS